jgi:hypothetical protein
MLAHDLAEDAQAIADSKVPSVNGRMDSGAVEAKRLQVELCKWLASRLYPEMYGDKVVPEVSYLADLEADEIAIELRRQPPRATLLGMAAEEAAPAAGERA